MANVRIDANGIPKGPIADPLAPADHRLNRSAADSGIPAASHSDWASNPGGFEKARVFAYVDFTGGTNPYLVLRPWLRNGGSSGKVGKGQAVTITGDDQVAVDVQVDGDDLLVFVESITGSPTTTDVDLYVSWR